jgi:hypothetical protein
MVYVRLHNYLYTEAYEGVVEMGPPIDGSVGPLNNYETVFWKFILSTRISL